jgi:hypothetical protein
MRAVREAPLEMARRHVRQGKAHVARQREIVAEAPAGSEFRQMAEDLLIVFEESLRLHSAHLAQLEAMGG